LKIGLYAASSIPEDSTCDMLHRELVSIRPLIERELIQFSPSRLGELSSSPIPNSRARLSSLGFCRNRQWREYVRRWWKRGYESCGSSRSSVRAL